MIFFLLSLSAKRRDMIEKQQRTLTKVLSCLTITVSINRSNCRHTYFCFPYINILIRIMEGVRRWIGAHPGSSPRKSKTLAKPDNEVHNEVPEPKPINPDSSEAIVARLLSPTVSEAEESEYQWSVLSVLKQIFVRLLNWYGSLRYIEQYQTLVTNPNSGVQRMDLEKYSNVVRIAAGAIDGLEDTSPDHMDVEYVEGTGGPSEGSLAPYYEKWISSEARLSEGFS